MYKLDFTKLKTFHPLKDIRETGKLQQEIHLYSTHLTKIWYLGNLENLCNSNNETGPWLGRSFTHMEGPHAHENASNSTNHQRDVNWSYHRPEVGLGETGLSSLPHGVQNSGTALGAGLAATYKTESWPALPPNFTILRYLLKRNENTCACKKRFGRGSMATWFLKAGKQVFSVGRWTKQQDVHMGNAIQQKSHGRRQKRIPCQTPQTQCWTRTPGNLWWKTRHSGCGVGRRGGAWTLGREPSRGMAMI